MSFQFDSVIPKRSQQFQHMMFSSVYSVCFFVWPALVFNNVLGEFNLLFEQEVNFAKNSESTLIVYKFNAGFILSCSKSFL